MYWYLVLSVPLQNLHMKSRFMIHHAVPTRILRKRIYASLIFSRLLSLTFSTILVIKNRAFPCTGTRGQQPASRSYVMYIQTMGMWRVWVRRGECIGSWWGNRREGDHWRDLGVDGWIILGWISMRWDVGIYTGLGWPRIETGSRRLWVR